MALLEFLKAIDTTTPLLIYSSITPFLPSRYTVFPPPSTAVMGSKPRMSVPTAARRLRRRLSHSSTRLRKRQLCNRRSTAAASSVSGKLEALRILIPSENADTKPDQLFRETADYIILLKTQVLFLQKLVDFYGSRSEGNGDGV